MVLSLHPLNLFFGTALWSKKKILFRDFSPHAVKLGQEEERRGEEGVDPLVSISQEFPLLHARRLVHVQREGVVMVGSDDSGSLTEHVDWFGTVAASCTRVEQLFLDQGCV